MGSAKLGRQREIVIGMSRIPAAVICVVKRRCERDSRSGLFSCFLGRQFYRVRMPSMRLDVILSVRLGMYYTSRVLAEVVQS